MARDDRPPRFKPFSAPLATTVQKQQRTGRHRGSPRDRGYDAHWDRLSLMFRRAHPFCLWCELAGRDTLTALVDHVLPVQDFPGLRYSWKNLEALCVPCHGLKATMEIYARANGLLMSLPEWCADPMSRPLQFRPLVG